MGKGAAKFGFKSGVLPVTRSILKHPTVTNTTLRERLTRPLPKGENGVGYADGIKEPKGSSRDPKPVKFIDVKEVIRKTVPEPSTTSGGNGVSEGNTVKAAKVARAALRRKYLTDALLNEEARALRREELLKLKREIQEREAAEEFARSNVKKDSDLTIPSLKELISQPLMRRRTPEEEKLMKLKRKYNREFIEFKAEERKLEKLLQLYYETDHYIITEQQLMAQLDSLFDDDRFRTFKYGSPVAAEFKHNTKRNILETQVGDALFGTVKTNHPGLASVKDFLRGDSEKFSKEIAQANQRVAEERQNSF